MALEREEFRDWLITIRQDIKDGIEGVHERLDELNSRTRKAENQIAVLEDRGHRDTTARAQGLGGMVASAAALLWQWLGK
jgi:pyrimidine operon attenuation protein/uracil phosphoribosyltransferase